MRAAYFNASLDCTPVTSFESAVVLRYTQHSELSCPFRLRCAVWGLIYWQEPLVTGAVIVMWNLLFYLFLFGGHSA